MTSFKDANLKLDLFVFRSGCFGTGYFYGCMDTILLQSELKSEITVLLDEMHGHTNIKRK